MVVADDVVLGSRKLEPLVAVQHLSEEGRAVSGAGGGVDDGVKILGQALPLKPGAWARAAVWTRTGDHPEQPSVIQTDQIALPPHQPGVSAAGHLPRRRTSQPGRYGATECVFVFSVRAAEAGRAADA